MNESSLNLPNVTQFDVMFSIIIKLSNIQRIKIILDTEMMPQIKVAITHIRIICVPHACPIEMKIRGEQKKNNPLRILNGFSLFT